MGDKLQVKDGDPGLKYYKVIYKVRELEVNVELKWVTNLNCIVTYKVRELDLKVGP